MKRNFETVDSFAFRVTEDMVEAGVKALGRLCPIELCFPIGGEEEAVRAVWKEMLRLHLRSVYLDEK